MACALSIEESSVLRSVSVDVLKDVTCMYPHRLQTSSFSILLHSHLCSVIAHGWYV